MNHDAANPLINTWEWKKEGDFAVCVEPFSGPSKYNEKSIRDAYEYIKTHRKEYATEEARLRQKRKFWGGVALFT